MTGKKQKEVSVLNGEHIEYLGEGVSLNVSPRHTFGTDALLLADIAMPSRREKTACDLGTGCGIIPFRWLAAGWRGRACAVDISAEAVEMLTRSVEACPAAKDVIIPVNADLRTLRNPAGIPSGSFDVVCMNPPYVRSGGGILSGDGEAATARHETQCDLYDVSRAAASLLRSGGRFCVCLRPDRLTDALCAMRECRVEPKTLRFAVQRKDPESGKDREVPWLVLIEGRRDGRPGLTVQGDLYIESAEAEKIFSFYRK